MWQQQLLNTPGTKIHDFIISFIMRNTLQKSDIHCKKVCII